jgi:hypothetical protein
MIRSFAPLDRLSTWDEVRSAMSITSQAGFAVGDNDNIRDTNTDFSHGASNLLEDEM